MSAGPVPATAGRTSEEVRRALTERIGNGQLRPGQRLGAERALATELGVSRATLRSLIHFVSLRPRIAHLVKCHSE